MGPLRWESSRPSRLRQRWAQAGRPIGERIEHSHKQCRGPASRSSMRWVRESRGGRSACSWTVMNDAQRREAVRRVRVAQRDDVQALRTTSLRLPSVRASLDQGVTSSRCNPSRDHWYSILKLPIVIVAALSVRNCRNELGVPKSLVITSVPGAMFPTSSE